MSSYSLLLTIGFSLTDMQDDDNMAYKVLASISQAARDCVTREKTIMTSVTEVDQLVRPKLRLSGNIIAMGMGYYHRVRPPCSGYQKLFFNRLLYVLYGVVGNTIKDLTRNTGFFKSFYFCMNVTSN